MKILHVTNNMATGGAERLLSDLLPLLNADKDVSADLFILNRTDSIYIDNLIKAGIKISYSSKYSIYNPVHIISLIRLMKKYDIVHSHLFPTQYWVAFASIILRKKITLITSEHNTFNRRRNSKVFRLIDKFVYSKYDHIISISLKTRLDLESWLEVKNNKFCIIENGINVKNFSGAKAHSRCEMGFSDDDFLIAMIARFDAQKDQETCIKALQHLPKDVKLLLIGDGPNIGKCKDMAKTLGLEDTVHFLGIRKDIPQILKMIDAGVLSSHWEGFGLVAVECMAAGKPIIASDVDGLREVVNNYGLLFKTGDSTELSEKIKYLRSNKSKYIEISEKCSNRAKSYDIINMKNAYSELYRNCMNAIRT